MSHAVRFHFCTGPDGYPTDQADFYHRDLIEAEVLLDRAVAAHALGLRAIHGRLGAAMIAAAMERPPRAQLSGELEMPEYVRWYAQDGAPRVVPLTQEALIQALVQEKGLPTQAAAHLVETHSHALSAIDTDWVSARAGQPIASRPLDASEFRQLAQSLDAAYRGAGSEKTSSVHANARLAIQAAAATGQLFAGYQPSPFHAFELSHAYSVAHARHLWNLAQLAHATSLEAKGRAPGSAEASWAEAKAKQAEAAARWAARAARGMPAHAAALSIRLDTADGREIWWSVMAVDPDGVRDSAVCEAIVRPQAHEQRAGDVSVVAGVIDVHGADGALVDSFEVDGGDWRWIEKTHSQPALYRRLLEGEFLVDVLHDMKTAHCAEEAAA